MLRCLSVETVKRDLFRKSILIIYFVKYADFLILLSCRLNDAPSRINRGRSRSRSRSRNRIQNTGSIQDRLGIRQGPNRMRRSIQNQRNGAGQQQQQRGRSRSRTRLNRNNFRPQQQQQAQLRRSNSVNARLGNNRQVRNRSRSRNNFKQNAGQLRRSGSINARLGTAKRRIVAGNRINQFNRPMTGRIIKRKVNRKVGVRKANAVGNVGNAAARNAKKLQRWIL